MKRALSLIVAIVMLFSTLVIAPAAVAESDPVVSRFAVVSDVHVNPTNTTTLNAIPKIFDTAYAYAQKQGGTVDAFVFNGDNVDGNQTSKGYTNQAELELFFQGVKDNVKSESKVLMTFARTHDIYDGDGNIFYVKEAELNAIIAEKLGTDGSIIPTADWGYGPHLNMVNGVPVITLSNDMNNGNDVTQDDDGNANNDDNADNSYHDSEAWLDSTLASLVAQKPDQPIFVVFHYPETGKLGWTQRWGQNSLRDTLNKYPQVITLNAHVHWDPRLSDSITQDRFTEIYDGGIRDVGGPDATTVSGGSSPVVSYAMVEVTQSGAVTVKYIDPYSGELLQEANGSGETLVYSIPKAWDKSTYLYTDEAKFATEKATFAADASVKLQNGTLTFDRAASEQPVIRYRVDVSDGKKTTTQYVFSELYNKVLPASYSCALNLKTGVDYTVTVTAIDGLYRESANTLEIKATINNPDLAVTGSATAVAEKTYGENGAKGEIDYPDFKTYTTNVDAENITNWGISDYEDLQAWSDFSKTNSCTGLTFHLENDIDMKDRIFDMIGSVYVPFKGTFDGHLHTLSNLLIDDASGMGTGFFVYTVDATVQNFGIESGLVRGHVSNRKYENAGSYSLSGSKRTPFSDVIGVGAIAGRADNTDFSHVWNKADVTFRMGNTLEHACYAGLVGRAQLNSSFVGCYNTGDVHGFNRASGITNWAQNGVYAAQISNCFNLGTITSESGTTEAIARYNTVNASDLPFFCFNNYYLAGSADTATSRTSAEYTASGAEEPIALPADEVTELATLLNEKRFSGLYTDTATWDTDENGNVFIKSVDDSDTGNIYPIAEFEQHPAAIRFSVASGADFKIFADLVNAKKIGKNITILQTADIDLKDYPNVQVGTGRSDKDLSAMALFEATYDGQNHKISNYTLSKKDVGQGLFKNLSGTVKNLVIENANVSVTSHSGILVGETYSATNLIENVHIKNSTITASARRVAFFLYGYNFSGATVNVKNCTVSGCTMNTGTTTGNPVSMIVIRDEVAGSVIENTYAFNNTINVQATGTTVCGIAGDGRQTTITNCGVFNNTYTGTAPSAIYGINGTTNTNTTINNCYTDEAKLTPKAYKGDNNYAGVTDAELTDGSLAYKLGQTVKDGYVALPQKRDELTHCYTYVMADTTEVRYTDATGAVINGAPTVTAEDFLGWTVTKGAKEGDLVYTASYGTEDNGTYPISEFANRPKAKKFTVSNAEELCTLATLSKSNTFEGYTITVLQDIDLSGVAFSGIGSGGSHFMGTFDGGNHTVYNMTYSSTSDYYGFFRALEGTVQNLTLEDAAVSVAGGDASGIVVAWAYGTTKLQNVKVRYSSISQSGKDMVAAMIGWVNKSNGNYTLENCVVEGCSISNGNQQAAALVGTYSHNVTVKNCKVINSSVTGHRQVGLVSAFATGLKVEGLIAYGNTIKANWDSVGIIGRANNDAALQNIVAYNNNGTIANTEESAVNKTSDSFFGRYTSDKPTISGSNLFNDVANDTTADPATVTAVTAAQIASGEIAYALGYAMKDGNITFADAANKAAVKYTYTANGQVVATLYTDANGNLIGNAPALPEGVTEWTVTELENGDMTFSANGEYDADATYPISKFEQYPKATKFSVASGADFKIFADLVNAKKIGKDITILQTADIDLKDYPNLRVGSDRSEAAAFAGTYDGQNYTLSHYKLTKTSEAYAGMFKGLSGTIKNLTIESADVSAQTHSAILVGETYGTAALIENVHIKNSSITVAQRRAAFMLYGFNTGSFTVRNCTVSGCSMSTGTTTGNPVGFIATKGDSANTVENTYTFNNIINVKAASTSIGEIVGDGRGTAIKNCGSFGNTYTGTTATVSGLSTSTNANTAITNSYTASSKIAAGSAFTGSNNYAGVTDAELADGSLAYKLKNGTATNWIQKTYPQVASGKAVTKQTYIVDGEEYAIRYTDSTGAVIGEAVALPEGATTWVVTEAENGDKTFETVAAYDENGTYPISKFELYAKAKKFTISTEEDLNKLATLSKSSNLAGYTFTLTADIDMKNTANFAMIGVGDNKDTCFAGTFDGAGYTISNLKMNYTTQVGMFLPKNATIKNFTLKDADVRGGRYSGIIIGSAAATTVSDVHIVGAYFNPNDDIRTYGGIAGYAYNAARAGAVSTFTRCSVQDSEFDCAPNGGVGLLVGEMCAGTLTDCYAINNTLKALNRSGILIGYSYGVTVDGCFTYGNTMEAQEGKDIDYPSGIAVGQVQTSATTVKNSIFCETDWDVYGYKQSGSITFENCYTLCADATAATVITAEQLASGEPAYKAGFAMKDGKLALANETDKAAEKLIYTVNGEEYAIRYTDSTGAMIGTVTDPTVEGFTFQKWEQNGNTYTAVLTPNVVMGDLSGEGTVDTADAVLLLQYLVNYEVNATLENADLNGDGRLSVYDAVLLLRQIAE